MGEIKQGVNPKITRRFLCFNILIFDTFFYIFTSSLPSYRYFFSNKKKKITKFHFFSSIGFGDKWLAKCRKTEPQKPDQI